MVVNLKIKISYLKHGYKPTNENKLFTNMVINLKVEISYLKHGHKSTNDNKLFKTWL